MDAARHDKNVPAREQEQDRIEAARREAQQWDSLNPSSEKGIWDVGTFRFTSTENQVPSHDGEKEARLLQVGDMIRDTYEVERYLSEGAFAEVYRVRHRFLGRQAMKVFKRPGMTQDEIEEMMSEAVLLSRIGHPNIVRVFDANVLETSCGQCGYFTMENIPGGSLDKFWRSHGGRLVPIETVIEIVKQVCRALKLAHTEDPPIIHRDIKPQNILIGYEADGLRARLSDFGLAKRVNKLTLLASAAGTLAFKPPEAFTQSQGDSTAGDVWAIGVTLYLLLTDSLPYEINPALGWSNQLAIDETPSPPSEFNVQVNNALDKIVMRCLAPRPDDRYANASALISALDLWKPGQTKKTLQPSATPMRSSKDALGAGTAPNETEAEKLAGEAIRRAKENGMLMDAADLMEEAFNLWPSLRQKHATRVQLWRRGISM